MAYHEVTTFLFQESQLKLHRPMIQLIQAVSKAQPTQFHDRGYIRNKTCEPIESDGLK